MAVDKELVRKAVKARYAKAAQATASCCQSAEESAQQVSGVSRCCCTTKEEEIVTQFEGVSLGCGDPLMIAALQLGETVLDLGSGAGLECFYAARQVGESGKVIGVDMTAEMIERANANKAKLGMTNVDFRLGYIEELPVESESIDVVISNCVINLAPDKKAVFDEAMRVLRPGGRISISDIVTQGDIAPHFKADMDSWSACISGAIDVDAYLDLMAQAGFVDIAVVDRLPAAERQRLGAEMPPIFSARIAAYKPS
jgi:arsenite methyltransferase